MPKKNIVLYIKIFVCKYDYHVIIYNTILYTQFKFVKVLPFKIETGFSMF